MNIQTVIRLWKDADFRDTLPQTERQMLPTSPVGVVELSDDALDGASGGTYTPLTLTYTTTTLTLLKPTSRLLCE